MAFQLVKLLFFTILDLLQLQCLEKYRIQYSDKRIYPEKSEIIREAESKVENSDTHRSEESLDNSAVKEILDIFPGAKVKK